MSDHSSKTHSSAAATACTPPAYEHTSSSKGSLEFNSNTKYGLSPFQFTTGSADANMMDCEMEADKFF